MRVLLVGGGHAHLNVLQRWAENPPEGAHLTLLVDEPDSVYSGMVPGFVAGDYSLEEISIALQPLARRCGATMVVASALRIDPQQKIVTLERGDAISYDLASLNVGSSVRGRELASAAAHAVPTRPIGEFARRAGERLNKILREHTGADATTAPPIRVVVVGGGAAGVELAFTCRQRLVDHGVPCEVRIACGLAGLLPGSGKRARSLIRREADRRGIHVAEDAEVLSVTEQGVQVRNEFWNADLLLWATGAAPGAFLQGSALPLGRDGFLRVAPTLAVPGCDGLFAVGDCATIDGAEFTAKAGVHAVRAGVVLDHNLRAVLRGDALRPFHPQRNFLSLLHLGDRRALATKWGLAASGRLFWHWKDRIDRGFVDRYRFLDDDNHA